MKTLMSKRSKNILGPMISALCLLAASASAQTEYAFQFSTSTPGFGGELFLPAPSGTGGTANLYGNSYIFTPDGTFTLGDSFGSGPFGIYPNNPLVWNIGAPGISTMNVNLVEIIGGTNYGWTATPTTISDVAGVILPALAPDPSATGTWVYIGAVPEPSTIALTAFASAALLRRRRN